MTEAVRYFHGGNRGLNVNGYILPPSATKVRSSSDYADMKGFHRKDRVYLTTELAVAEDYAAPNQLPIVYEVEPEGAIEKDPDCDAGHSYSCEKAKIIRMHKVPGKKIKRVKTELLRRQHQRERQARSVR
jgi:hypothetical protein